MLFRPSFCANCGEKIERAEWSIWTSRRFCPVCESEFKGHDLVPRAVVGLGVVAGVLGLGSYLRSGSAAEMQPFKQPRKLVEQTGPVSQLAAVNTEAPRPETADSTLIRQPAPANSASTANAVGMPRLAKPHVESA